MMKLSIGMLAAVVSAGAVAGEIEFAVTPVEFELDGKTYASRVVGPADAGGLPAIFMVPNWMGVTDRSVEKAMYSERTSQRAFHAMWSFFEEVLVD